MGINRYTKESLKEIENSRQKVETQIASCEDLREDLLDSYIEAHDNVSFAESNKIHFPADEQDRVENLINELYDGKEQFDQKLDIVNEQLIELQQLLYEIEQAELKIEQFLLR